MVTNSGKRTAAAVVLMLLAVAFALRMVYEDLQNAMLQSIMLTVRNMIHVSLLGFWILSLYRRLVNRNVRRLMLAVGMLLMFWLLDKIVKWDFTGSETHWLVRYLWYGFYVGMLFVPTLGVFIIDHLGKPDDHSHPRGLNWLLLPPAVLLLCVFTNDLHRKVFVFYNGLINFDREYSYDWLYFIIMGWFILLGFYFVGMLLVKSRVPGSRRLQRMPLFIMAGAVLFWAGYSMRLYDCDLTVTDCLIIALLLESAIQTGLLPSNMNYQQIFDSTTVPVQILDRDLQPHYVSGGALPVAREHVQASLSGTVRLKDSLLSSAPVRGGYVLWQDDISQLNALQTELQDATEQLGEENILLQAELELKEKRARADEKNRLYDRIAREVEPQLKRTEKLLEQLCAGTGDPAPLMAQLCVLGSYIKRRGNLLLLGEDPAGVSARELEYCIRESLENLQLCGVSTALVAGCCGSAEQHHLIGAYDLFEQLVELLLERITAVMVDLESRDGILTMKLQIGCDSSIDPEQLRCIRLPGGQLMLEVQEEDLILRVTLGREGGVE